MAITKIYTIVQRCIILNGVNLRVNLRELLFANYVENEIAKFFKKITSSWIQNIDDKKYLIESNSIFSEYFVSIFQKLIDNLSFQIINLIILILYRTGYKGEFLGVGGTWNLNEDKNPDAEMVASGVLVGFFIYTSVVLISYCFGSMYHKKTLVVRSIFINFKNEKKSVASDYYVNTNIFIVQKLISIAA